jgi:hypothetical protein
MSTDSLPTIPPLPDDAPLDVRLRHAVLLMRVAEYAQRERSNAATEKLAQVQARSADAVERTMTEGLPSDQPMVAAINGLRDAIAGAGAGAGGNASAVGKTEQLIALVSTMTSQQRSNPTNAAAAAAAQLAAIQARA